MSTAKYTKEAARLEGEAAALETAGKPVAYEFSRIDQFTIAPSRHPMRVSVRAGADADAPPAEDDESGAAVYDAAYCAEARANADVILIDTPGGDTVLSNAAHGLADQIVDAIARVCAQAIGPDAHVFAAGITTKMTQMTAGEPEDQLRGPFENLMADVAAALGWNATGNKLVQPSGTGTSMSAG